MCLSRLQSKAGHSVRDLGDDSMHRLIAILALACMSGCPCCILAQEVYSQLPVNQPGYVWVEVATNYEYSQVRTSSSYTSTTQQYAIAEASRLASGGVGYYRRTGGHPGGNMPGSRFTGTGYGPASNNVPTCEPRTRMTLIADAVQRGVDGMYYRVRAWK